MSLQSYDKDIYDLVNLELKRQCDHLEMIASENFTYPEVMEVMGSILTNKYAEGYPGKRYYGGCEFVDEIEQIAIDRCKELFGCEFANVQPNSGSQANQGVYGALLNPGDKILGMDLSHGGHLTHGAKVSSSGKMYESFFYGVELDGRINYDRVMDIAKIVKPKMIVCGASAYTREIEFKKFREIADAVGAILFADVAHIAGLVVAGEHQSPFPYCDVVSSTTHKTLRGPRGGIIMTNNEEYAKKINASIFPGIQGGPLVHVIAAKAVGFGENLLPSWKEYAMQVKKNASVLAQALVDKGFSIVSDGTDNHSMLLDLRQKYPDLTGKVAETALVAADITANKNKVPYDERSAFQTSGLRLGTAAMTTRGCKEDMMLLTAELIDEVLADPENEQVIKRVREKVNETMAAYPLFAY